MNRTLTVVVVDDQSPQRALFRAVLEQVHGANFTFHEARDGRHGLELCRQAEPDCVLINHTLPDMDGTEFVRRLRGTAVGTVAHQPERGLPERNRTSERQLPTARFLHRGSTNGRNPAGFPLYNLQGDGFGCRSRDADSSDENAIPVVSPPTQIRATHENSDPVVILTGLESETEAIAAVRAGAQDCLIKDRLTPEALLLAIEKAAQKIQLIQALRSERDRMARSLAEKDLLVKEVHHRVKNNLQVIASLLRLRADNLEDRSAVTALRNSQHRVEAMALAHEQLYASEDLRQVDLGRHARHVLANLFLSYGVDRSRIGRLIDISAEGGAPLVLGVDQAIPAGLILNELVSNALLHAFPGDRKGQIWVLGSNVNGRVVLTVRDDGVGMPTGFDLERTRSLGLQIIYILARQLKGTVDVQAEGGASFRISFPASQPEAQTRSHASGY